jgi:hypothetical protein
MAITWFFCNEEKNGVTSCHAIDFFNDSFNDFCSFKSGAKSTYIPVQSWLPVSLQQKIVRYKYNKQFHSEFTYRYIP